MATAGGDADGYFLRNKRCRASAGGDDHGYFLRSKRCRGSSAADEPGHVSVDDTGEDFIYDDDSNDAGEDYTDEEEETNSGDSPATSSKKGYTILTESAILSRQQKAMADVAEVLSIPPTFAALLLRHFKWSPSRVKHEWFSSNIDVRSAVGLPPPENSTVGAMAFSPKRLTCGICFTKFYAGKMRSAGCCSHFYCDDCWKGYIHAGVGDGPRCLSLRCPEPTCTAAVASDLVFAVAGDEDKDHYAQFALRSYVEDRASGGIKWCPATGCDLAVELAGGNCDEVNDVFCDCRHGFCWRCGEEAHRPVSCETVKAWLEKNSSDAESANWVLVNTKLCPKCQKPIEKNEGCNHMTCRCGHEFCWLCLDSYSNYCRCSGYVDVVVDRHGKAARKEEKRRRQAKASLDRYLYHYERWAANHKSLKKVFNDMNELEKSGLEKMAVALEIKVEDLEFLIKAYELVADGRRVMRWVYAYGYYLDPVRDKAKRGLFDHLHDDANSRLERRKFFSSKEEEKSGSDMNEMYRAYKKKLEDLTRATRHYFGNLVKAFETDLPELNSVEKK